MIPDALDLSDIKILVVGDVMLDIESVGNPHKISVEDPVLVVNANQIKHYAGGAANVAINAANLGAKTALLTVLGEDIEGRELLNIVNKNKVDVYAETIEFTTTKYRIRAKHQQLLRIDRDNYEIHENTHQLMLNKYKDMVCEYDIVILSDYAKGVLQTNAKDYINIAKAYGIPIFTDPKSSNFGLYAGSTLITPNKKEFEMAIGHYETEEEFELKARSFLKNGYCEILIVTLGPDGIALVSQDQNIYRVYADKDGVLDVTGAGDTAIATLACVYAKTKNLHLAVDIASAACAIVVRKLGTASISISELNKFLLEKLESGLKTKFIDVNDPSFKKLLQLYRLRNDKIVMTCGCFDIIHAGHIMCLKLAKQHGDKLIVCLNTDESIKAIKGDNRPLHCMEDRIAVLSALDCVDYILPMNEQTPLNLIDIVKPHYWVKGGDYKAEALPEYELINSYGGEILIKPFLSGRSTSNIALKIIQEDF